MSQKPLKGTVKKIQATKRKNVPVKQTTKATKFIGKKPKASIVQVEGLVGSIAVGANEHLRVVKLKGQASTAVTKKKSK